VWGSEDKNRNIIGGIQQNPLLGPPSGPQNQAQTRSSSDFQAQAESGPPSGLHVDLDAAGTFEWAPVLYLLYGGVSRLRARKLI